MSIYTVNGSPVMHDGKFLTTGGTSDLPEYDSEDANKVLKVSPDGQDIGWYDDDDTTYTAGNGLTLNGTEFSVDTSVVATQSDLSGKQDKLTAGQNITIDADNVISATGGGGSSYTAGTGIDITGDVISADTTVLATQTDLSGKQDALTAGTNITISNNVISATDTTYSAGTGIDITGTTISADTTVLATQQDLTGKQDTLTAGSNITISNNVISATAAPQVQSDWAESNTSDVSYIQNKPTEKTLAAGSNVTITEASNIVTISATDTTYTAGTGIRISNNVISADDAVLWSGTRNASSITLSESATNFEYLKFIVEDPNNEFRQINEIPADSTVNYLTMLQSNSTTAQILRSIKISTSDYLTYTMSEEQRTRFTSNNTIDWATGYGVGVVKVVGINRIASA